MFSCDLQLSNVFRTCKILDICVRQKLLLSQSTILQCTVGRFKFYPQNWKKPDFRRHSDYLWLSSTELNGERRVPNVINLDSPSDEENESCRKMATISILEPSKDGMAAPKIEIPKVDDSEQIKFQDPAILPCSSLLTHKENQDDQENQEGQKNQESQEIQETRECGENREEKREKRENQENQGNQRIQENQGNRGNQGNQRIQGNQENQENCVNEPKDDKEQSSFISAFLEDLSSSDSESEEEIEGNPQRSTSFYSEPKVQERSFEIDARYIWCPKKGNNDNSRFHLPAENPFEDHVICSICNEILPFNLPVTLFTLTHFPSCSLPLTPFLPLFPLLF